MLETNNDITERKRAEMLTAVVFDSSPDGIAIIGRDYRYRRVNPVRERRWGIPAERIVGMHDSEVVGIEAFEQNIKPNLDRCFAGEEATFSGWLTVPRPPSLPPLGRRAAFRECAGCWSVHTDDDVVRLDERVCALAPSQLQPLGRVRGDNGHYLDAFGELDRHFRADGTPNELRDRADE